MNIKLERPLICFDLETTGLQISKDRIVEICMIKLNPDGTKEEFHRYLNPDCPIPEETSRIHHIYDSDVKDKPTFSEIADELTAFIADADLAGYNSNYFDVPLLVEEFLRCEKPLNMRGRRLIDVQHIFHKMEPRTLKAAYKFYCNKELEGAHSADCDTAATLEILMAQIDRYKEVEYEDKEGNKSCPIKPNVKDLSDFTTNHRTLDFAAHIVLNDEQEAVFNFGKYKGKSVKMVFDKEPAYYTWIMNSDFPLNTKEVVTRIMEEIRIEKLKHKFNS